MFHMHSISPVITIFRAKQGLHFSKKLHHFIKGFIESNFIIIILLEYLQEL